MNIATFKVYNLRAMRWSKQWYIRHAPLFLAKFFQNFFGISPEYRLNEDVGYKRRKAGRIRKGRGLYKEGVPSITYI